MVDNFAQWLTTKIRLEHSRQGHTLTGRAEKTLQWEVKPMGLGVEISIYGQPYMKRTDAGVSAEKTGSWEAEREGLTMYSKLRFKVPDKESKRIAYFIWRKHKKEGNPTKASYQFSSTGKRTEYIEDVLNSKEFDDKFSQMYENMVLTELKVILQ